MTNDEAKALEPGTLLHVCEAALLEEPETNMMGIDEVVAKHGHLFIFTSYGSDSYAPVWGRSIATGGKMNFKVSEIETAEQADAET